MFLVVYDDQDCLCVPQVWDKDCDGAICTGNSNGKDTVALFDSRKAARAAIDISTKFAELCKADIHARLIFGVTAGVSARDARRIVEGAVEMFMARYGTGAPAAEG